MRFVTLLFLPFFLLAALPVSAADDIADHPKSLNKIERSLKRAKLNEESLQQWAEQISATKIFANACVAETEKQQKKLQEDLTSLGEPIKGESAAVTRKRNEVQKELTSADKQLADCKLLLLRSDELLQKIDDRRKELLASRMFARGPTIIALIRDHWHETTTWLAATRNFLRDHSGVELLSIDKWFGVILILIVSLAIGIVLRRILHKWAAHQHWDSDFSSRLAHASIQTLAYYSPHIFTSIVAAIMGYIITHGVHPLPFIGVLAYGLPAYWVFVAVTHLLLAPAAPAAPAGPFLEVKPELARALSRRIQILGLLVFLGYLLFSTLLAQSLPEPAMLLTRSIYAAFLILNLIWALWLLVRLPRLVNMRGLTFGGFVVLTGALISEWLGYRNLSLFILRAVLGTLLAFGMLLFGSRVFRELFDGIEQGRHRWHRQLRRALGLQADDRVPGLVWLRLITTLALWGLFAYTALNVWGVSETILREIETYVSEGFMIGSLRVIPLRIGMALVTFALLVVVSGWLRNRIERHWLPRAHLERGALEATVTITGYLFVAIALLIGLGVAGFDFGSLAIIAGALSVGIGFGLQNIVNNFVSGLILLFERPIKTGDWIMVGDTEGYVKRIRIRSTQIQTFDRADVIVPNSSLIANQVTNWMLYDRRGRIRIPIGVAYGSDTQKVKDVLEQVAQEHPSVITDESSPIPKVLFRGFGDSSLDFELRCHIRNIDERLQVISDLNFAIDAQFREANIEIPFPQRDIHIRDHTGKQQE